jgi:hypothetical protein
VYREEFCDLLLIGSAGVVGTVSRFVLVFGQFQVMASLHWLRPPGVWLRLSMLNSLVFSLRMTVRASHRR